MKSHRLWSIERWRIGVAGIAGVLVIGLVPLVGPAPASAASVGHGWSLLSTPNRRGQASQALQGVSCVSATFCIAVGSYLDGAIIDETLVESWNGQRWSVVPSPGDGADSNQLSGVSCVSAGFCVAVGKALTGSGNNQTVIESWNGTSWVVVPSLDVGTGSNMLGAVSCVSASSCTAVGSYQIPNSGSRVLIESWNGSGWSIQQNPAGTDNDSLTSVSCASASWCVAVGGSGSNQTTVMAWNGTTWSVVPSINVGTFDV